MYLGCESSQEAVSFASEGWGASCLLPILLFSLPSPGIGVQLAACGASSKPKLCCSGEETRCNLGLFSQDCMMCRQTGRSSRCPRLCIHVGVWLSSFILGWEAAEISGFTMGPFLSQGRQETHHSSETSQKLLTLKTWSNLQFPECLPCPFLLQLFPKWLT